MNLAYLICSPSFLSVKLLLILGWVNSWKCAWHEKNPHDECVFPMDVHISLMHSRLFSSFTSFSWDNIKEAVLLLSSLHSRIVASTTIIPTLCKNSSCLILLQIKSHSSTWVCVTEKGQTWCSLYVGRAIPFQEINDGDNIKSKADNNATPNSAFS